ncbi:MAG: murein biosynthesis integral membrane protein MurJ [Deltaproteobacteria bacterium]|nr:murein biosynthesis integral membrane protein MurJ [Deltaproteobacteria bacterium]MBW1942729.1 murein biosynthesis integral membrane protein MurJ [Deltaproteobacteria bacterium]MBW2205681.1 murein biosynthesis integral membrane protein MurJ [Deltaproteobacteria bacterium]
MSREKHHKENVSQAAGTVGFYTFLSRILGLVRDMVIAKYFGSGPAADAFFVAFRIPNLLRRLFAEGSLTIAFIPVFGEYLVKKTREDAFQVARVVLTLLSLLLALVTALGILLAPWIVRLQAFGFGGSGFKYDLTVLLTRITFPYIFLISLVALFMGMLNSLRHFAAPAAAPIFLNVGIIASTLWISPHLSEPIVAVAVGVIVGGILQVALQIPWVLEKGLSLAPCWMPRHPAVKRIGLLMLPAIFGSAIYQFNQFIGTLLASFLPDGSISWLYYADRLVQFPLGVFAIAISTAALPSLSRQAAQKDLVGFGETLNHAMRLVFFIAIPAMVGLIVLRRPIIELLFERGAFDALSTTMTSSALLFYALGLWAFSGIRVMVSGFYALQDTKTPVKIAAVALIANLGLSLLLMGPLKHGGLALALSFASTVQFALLVLFLKTRVQILDLHGIFKSAAKCLVASICMGAGIYLVHGKWMVSGVEMALWGNIVNLTGLVLLGIILYFMGMAILGPGELKSLMGSLKRGRGRKTQ